MQYSGSISKNDCFKTIRSITAAIDLLAADGSARSIAYALCLTNILGDYIQIYEMFDD